MAISGIGFAVVLMFMQTGFKNALFDSTVQILQDLNADLVLVAKARYALPANQTFTIGRIYQARACEGVRAAYPLYIERPRAVWKQPDGRGYPDPRAGLRAQRPCAADPRSGPLRRAAPATGGRADRREEQVGLRAARLACAVEPVAAA